MLSGDEGVEIGLLLRAAAEVHGDGLERRGAVDGADVLREAGAGRLRAGDRGARGVGNGRGETGLRLHLRLLGVGHRRKKKSANEKGGSEAACGHEVS